LLQPLIDLVVALGVAGTGFVLAVAFLAGVLRGYTGFGFALAAVPTLSLLLDPADIVPAITVITLVGGIRLVVRAQREADWRSTFLLLAGAVAGLPAGVLLLRHLPADPMRAVIGLVVLGAVLALWRGFSLSHAPSQAMRLALGAVSGLLNGSTSMGGPPVIIYFLASPAGHAAGRASLLVYFFFLGIVTVAAAAIAGLITARVLWLSLLMLPAMSLGNALGARLFDRSTASAYRRVALLCLAVVAAMAVVRAVAGLADGF
jgi:hypothetical protein